MKGEVGCLRSGRNRDRDNPDHLRWFWRRRSHYPFGLIVILLAIVIWAQAPSFRFSLVGGHKFKAEQGRVAMLEHVRVGSVSEKEDMRRRRGTISYDFTMWTNLEAHNVSLLKGHHRCYLAPCGKDKSRPAWSGNNERQTGVRGNDRVRQVFRVSNFLIIKIQRQWIFLAEMGSHIGINIVGWGLAGVDKRYLKRSIPILSFDRRCDVLRMIADRAIDYGFLSLRRRPATRSPCSREQPAIAYWWRATTEK